MPALNTNLAFQRALISLAHPASVGALLVLLLNDHVLRRMWPSWWTGKIGDFAWLIFRAIPAPAILSWLIPFRVYRREEIIGRASIIGTGLVFGLAKTLPAFHALTIQVLDTLTGWHNTLRVDPTDLLALPALLVAWHLWKQAEARPRSLPLRGWVLFPLAMSATMANSPMPDYGITHLGLSSCTISAGSFRSEEGGLVWQGEGHGSSEYPDRRMWLLADSADARVQYRFTPGVWIERSEDGGQSWKTEVRLVGDEARLAYIRVSGRNYYVEPIGPLDAVTHRPTGNVVAMGQEGVLVRTPDGVWHWVAVGQYSVPTLSRVDQILRSCQANMAGAGAPRIDCGSDRAPRSRSRLADALLAMASAAA